MGSVSPASTVILRAQPCQRPGRGRAGPRRQGSTYPFSPLLMNFCTSFTPRRSCLCLVAAREARREGLSENRGVRDRTAPPPSPGPSRQRRRTFPDALEQLSGEFAGRERLRDGVQEVELLPVRELRRRLRLGRRLRLLPRHGRHRPNPLPGRAPQRGRDTRPTALRQPIGTALAVTDRRNGQWRAVFGASPGHELRPPFPTLGSRPSPGSSRGPSPSSGPLPVPGLDPVPVAVPVPVPAPLLDPVPVPIPLPVPVLSPVEVPVPVMVPVPVPVSGRPGQASTRAFIGCGQCG